MTYTLRGKNNLKLTFYDSIIHCVSKINTLLSVFVLVLTNETTSTYSFYSMNCDIKGEGGCRVDR